MRVSVVVPTFNREAWIGRTLRSVLAQSRTPHEVIVVDDGSTDATEAAVSAFGERVRYVRQANAGVAAARNHGARLATGEWLAFVDSDDLWLPRKLEWQLAALAAAPAARWSVTGCDVIDFEDRPVPGRGGFEGTFPVFRQQRLSADAFLARFFAARRVTVGADTVEFFEGDAFEPLFLGNFGLPSSVVVDRALFLDAGGFDPAFRLAEETEFFHRIAARAPAVILRAALVGYRMGQSGSLVSPANAGRLIENALRSHEQAAALRPAPSAADAARRAEGRRQLLQRLAYTRLSNLDRAGARDALRRAWGAGAPRDARSLALFTAALLPSPALAGLHRLKRVLA